MSLSPSPCKDSGPERMPLEGAQTAQFVNMETPLLSLVSVGVSVGVQVYIDPTNTLQPIMYC